jgi:tRNA-2-methylthio-N6-dimethylallyladenosine synthase
MEDDVSEERKSERLSALQDLQKHVQQRLNAALIGSVQEVLIESHSRKGEGQLSGRTSCNRVVNMPGSKERIGLFVEARIEDASANCLFGTPAAV